MNGNNGITDEYLYGQGSDTEVVSAAVAEDFCPYLLAVCPCWVDGECKAGKCLCNNIQRTAESGQK